MGNEFMKAFYYKGERLFSYPLMSEEDDTQAATIEQLAFECDCCPEDIDIFYEVCAPKKRDFSRDCATERLDDRNGSECWRILNITNGNLYTHVGTLDDFAARYEAGTLSKSA